MEKTYRIYKLENPTTLHGMFKFYLPEEGVPKRVALERKATRHKELSRLKKRGYIVTASMLTDEEGYLNGKLHVAVEEYCRLDTEERTVRLSRYRYSDATLCKTLELIMESKQVALKQVVSLVRRLTNDDLLVQSGIALAIYDQYMQEIL